MSKQRMYNAQFLLKMPSDLLAKVRKAAHAEHLTPTQWIRNQLAKALGGSHD